MRSKRDEIEIALKNSAAREELKVDHLTERLQSLLSNIEREYEAVNFFAGQVRQEMKNGELATRQASFLQLSSAHQSPAPLQQSESRPSQYVKRESFRVCEWG